MNALERIAELHSEISRAHIGLPSICDACEHDWPCPTRRLCDEAAQHHAEWGCDECGEAFKRGAEAGRDHASDECVMAEMAARADADRLAAAQDLGRDAIGCDLDPRNADLARERVGLFLETEELQRKVATVDVTADRL